MSDVRSILYLCDGRACDNPDNCIYNGMGECRHTTRWEHALHKDADLKGFMSFPSREEGKVVLWEPFDD